MPVLCHYNRERNVILGEMSGVLTVDEAQANLLEILQSPEIPLDANALWDMRKVDFASINFEFMAGLINLRKNHPERGSVKIALVVSDDFSYGLGKMYKGHSDYLPQTIEIFQDYSQALAWLLNQSA